MLQNGRVSPVPLNLLSPRQSLSYEERLLDEHLSPTRLEMIDEHDVATANQYENVAGLAPLPEMFMSSPKSNY